MRAHILEPGEDTPFFTLADDGATLEIGVWRSAGTDGAWVVQIDTNFEPQDQVAGAEYTLHAALRVNLNDAPIFGKEYTDE